PAARELTAEAARAAGYSRMTLLEEPQAALYSWIQKSEGGWRKQVQVGDLILCVDVGGGTTDLSLIAVVERDGNLELHRVAVGEHILLGGDNAVVIALACRNLPANQRLRGVVWGTAGAILLRVALITFAVALLDVPFLKFGGGLLLLWIGIKLMA
ncbi:Hsp70 family protein, partial [Bacillus subtilis]|nr:Hsp70 family protein [Bacillus subtilis]